MTSQRAIILLSCCLGICLFALGFLLGRESNRVPATLMTAPPAALTAAPPQATEPTQELPAPPTKESPAPPLPEPPAVSPVAAAPAVSRVAAAPAVTSPARAPVAADGSGEKQAVTRYFREVDRLQNVDIANPEAAASSLVSAATSGDTSGLRQLVSKAREAEQKIRAIKPPPPCADYHEQLVSMLAESRSMLQRLEQGIGGGDLGALPALVSQANSAKARSEALAREGRELERRYGVN